MAPVWPGAGGGVGRRDGPTRHPASPGRGLDDRAAGGGLGDWAAAALRVAALVEEVRLVRPLPPDDCDEAPYARYLAERRTAPDGLLWLPAWPR